MSSLCVLAAVLIAVTSAYSSVHETAAGDQPMMEKKVCLLYVLLHFCSSTRGIRRELADKCELIFITFPQVSPIHSITQSRPNCIRVEKKFDMRSLSGFNRPPIAFKSAPMPPKRDEEWAYDHSLMNR